MPASNRTVVRERLAEADLAARARYLSEHSSPDAALRFLDAVEACFQQLAEMPEAGSLWDFSDPRLAAREFGPFQDSGIISFSIKSRERRYAC